MYITLLIIAALVSYPLGSTVDWILSSIFPKQPKKSQLFAGVIVACFLAILVTLPLFFGNGAASSEQVVGDSQAVDNPIQILNLLSISDKMFLTGYITIGLILSLMYWGYEGEAKRKYFPIGLSSFVSVFLLYAYFRLWLGANWWIYICVLPLLAIAFIKGINSGGVRTVYDTQPKELATIVPVAEPTVLTDVDNPSKQCAYCKGKGSLGLNPNPCPACGGKGSVLVLPRTLPCAYCKGKGSLGLSPKPCPVCNGTGWAHVA